LTGFAQRAYEFWQKELEPKGYKLHAQVLDFPGGMPGDVGMFLRWSRPAAGGDIQPHGLAAAGFMLRCNKNCHKRRASVRQSLNRSSLLP
jgi:hypothetical protein